MPAVVADENFRRTPGGSIFNRRRHPLIGQYRRELEKSMCRVYPLRLLNRVLRSMARHVFPDAFEIPELHLGFANTAALVYLPRECEAHLAAMASAPCALHVHRDVGLQGQAAYVCLAAPALPGHYQPALWLELDTLLQMHTQNLICEGAEFMPLILVAGSSMVLGQFNPDACQLQRYRDARRPGAVKSAVGRAQLRPAPMAAHGVRDAHRRPASGRDLGAVRWRGSRLCAVLEA